MCRTRDLGRSGPGHRACGGPWTLHRTMSFLSGAEVQACAPPLLLPKQIPNSRLP